mgnify:CR=1 FL=1
MKYAKEGAVATSMTKTFPVFDCDSHVVEPPAVWDEYVPAKERAWVKSQFCFHTDSDLLMINGRVVPAARERSNAAEVGWARWDKKEWADSPRHRRVEGEVRPAARLPRSPRAAQGHGRPRHRPGDALPHLVRAPGPAARRGAAAILSRAYNDWVHDYCAADRARLFPCAVLPLQSVEASIAELRRVARLGFKAAAVRPCFWNGRYPTLPDSTRCGASSSPWAWCWPCTPFPHARR